MSSRGGRGGTNSRNGERGLSEAAGAVEPEVDTEGDSVHSRESASVRASCHGKAVPAVAVATPEALRL